MRLWRTGDSFLDWNDWSNIVSMIQTFFTVIAFDISLM